MEIDHRVIRAVSAQTRLRMLKSLKARKKMPSELSKETGLSPSTVVEHLRNLENAGLIRRIETGHKWVYYELTDKGVNIVEPRMPVQFALTLGLGVLITSFGFLKAISTGTLSAGIRVQKSAVSEAVPAVASSADQIADSGMNAAQSMPLEWMYFLIAFAGLILVIYSVHKISKRKRNPVI